LDTDLTFETLSWPLAPVLVASGRAEQLGAGADAAEEAIRVALTRPVTAVEISATEKPRLRRGLRASLS
jgi:hypothetical protein